MVYNGRIGFRGGRMAIRVKLREVIGRWEAEHGETLSYRDLEGATKINRDTLSRLGRSKSKYISREDLATLCAFFSCTVDDLLEYVPDAKPPTEPNTAA